MRKISASSVENVTNMMLVICMFCSAVYSVHIQHGEIFVVVELLKCMNDFYCVLKYIILYRMSCMSCE